LPFAVIFDVDGVLIDSQPAVAKALGRALNQYGLKLDDVQGYHPAHSTKIVLEAIHQQHGVQIEATEFTRTLVEDITSQLQDVKIDPQLKSLIDKLRELKVPLAVGSSASRTSVLRKLAILGLSEAFSVILGAEDVPSHKPAPDVYLEAARRLGYDAGQCIVIEDNAVGVQAARAAAAHVVGFGGYNEDPSASFGADIHVSEWSKLSPKALEKLVKS
jgi:HAD superfamily hydrolase (TIGR01509 family)